MFRVAVEGAKHDEPLDLESAMQEKHKNNVDIDEDGFQKPKRKGKRRQASSRTQLSPGEALTNTKDFTSDPSTPPPSVPVMCGNPCVEVIRGKLHLYRALDEEPDPGSYGGVLYQRIGALPEKRSTTLCALMIPSYMTGSDFCQFCGSYLHNITQMRILRGEGSPQFMVLMTFKTQEAADEFYLEFFGKPFSSMGEETCKMVYVANIDLSDTMGGALKAHYTELPTCAVCLERLDQSISGVVTTICNHSFHCTCFQQYPDTTCPVCRFCQQPAETSSSCMECDETTNLWICLICGNVGCGRYQSEHALAHFHATQHAFSLELETQRVWDYVGDEYVHRLIQNKSDGKLVELPGQENSGAKKGGNDEDEMDALLASKMENMIMEYNYLLTSQLDAQRAYFEERMMEMEQHYQDRIMELQGPTTSAEDSSRVVQPVREPDLSEEDTNIAQKLAESEKERKAIERKLGKLTKDHEKLTKEAGFLKSLNDSLLQDKKGWKDEVDKLRQELRDQVWGKDVEIKELQEQIRDLMFFIEAQQKIEQSPHKRDIEGGAVVLGDKKEKTPRELLKEKTRRK